MEYITGLHAIYEHMEHTPGKKALFLSEHLTKKRDILQTAEKFGVTASVVPIEQLDRMVPHRKHRGLVLQVPTVSPNRNIQTFETFLEEGDKDKTIILILDSIQDPHNFGAILRSADQFGVDCVLIPKKRSVKETATVSRVSSGADAFINVFIVTNIISAIERLKKHGYWIYGADVNGESLIDADFSPKTALVLGSEGGGMRRLVKQRCDQLVRIPTKGHIDSLNVSVATGVLLYEIRRKQDFFKR